MSSVVTTIGNTPRHELLLYNDCVYYKSNQWHIQCVTQHKTWLTKRCVARIL